MKDFLNKLFIENWLKSIGFILISIGIPSLISNKINVLVTVPLGFILFLILIFFGLLWGFFVEKYFNINIKKIKPKYCEYDRDIFVDVLYEWKWEYHTDRHQWLIGHIISKCKECDFRFVSNRCQKCGKINFTSKKNDEISAYICYEVKKRYGNKELDII